MPDIIQEFAINAPPARVFPVISTADGLAQWWTKTSSGEAQDGAQLTLGFGPGYDWRAKVTRFQPGAEYELQLTAAHEDWQGTHVGFHLAPEGNGATRVSFHHTGWPEANEHWRVSCYCWATYLRLLKRYVEHGEVIPYERRLDV